MIHLLILPFSHFHYERAQQALPVVPFAFPLAVRPPYLNCWGALAFDGENAIEQKCNRNSNQRRPDSDPSLKARNFLARHNTRPRALTWSSTWRVDNKTSTFLGYDSGPTISLVNLINVVISPTQTMLIAEVEPMQINLTFLNPIEV
ncbi:hypothetical protein EDB83DRAFT_1293814 [Lactarius deliciosus]|nr:hypothetical protein EDB83DRAFT_1293814 [Lactarius deliciosus]